VTSELQLHNINTNKDQSKLANGEIDLRFYSPGGSSNLELMFRLVVWPANLPFPWESGATANAACQ